MSTRPPCAGLWNTPTVHADGTLTTCCLDEALENALGNVRDAPLRELWFGPRIHRWRLAQVEGRFEESGPYCSRCNWRSAGAYPPEKVHAYLEWAKEQGLPTRLDEALAGDGRQRGGD